GRSCTVNTVLWNTIQLLFPNEVSEARKSAAGALNSQEVERGSPESGRRSNRRARSVRPPMVISTRDAALAFRQQSEDLSWLVSTRTRRGTPSQSEDVALALRLQREQSMESFRRIRQQTRIPTPLSLARANLRAMASRAINIHRGVSTRILRFTPMFIVLSVLAHWGLQDFVNKTASRWLFRRIMTWDASLSVEASLASPRQAKLLNMK
ncbi:hypothetical protein Goari_013389, partial [Gossypium aridum]|nr:hypothetical protein [Gossypium aridum]